jgi:hypothetical protein
MASSRSIDAGSASAVRMTTGVGCRIGSASNRRRGHDARIGVAEQLEPRMELLVEDGDLAVEHERGAPAKVQCMRRLGLIIRRIAQELSQLGQGVDVKRSSACSRHPGPKCLNGPHAEVISHPDL